jgi:hypothetical protein
LLGHATQEDDVERFAGDAFDIPVLCRLDIDITIVRKKTSAKQRKLLSAAFELLAAAHDGQGGTNGHFIGDGISFANIAITAYVEWLLVHSDEVEYVLTLTAYSGKGFSTTRSRRSADVWSMENWIGG